MSKKKSAPMSDAETKAAEARMRAAELVRIYQASVKIKGAVSTSSLLLRDGTANSLIAHMKRGELTSLQITRLFESSCEIDFSEDNDDRFHDILATELVRIHKLNAKPRIPTA